MAFAGLLFMHRLVKICTYSQSHLRDRAILKLIKRRTEKKLLSTSSLKCNGNERDDSCSPPLSTKLTPRQELLSRRMRPLSPLERISSLLPQDALSPEVMQLREQNHQVPKEYSDIQVSVTHCTQGEQEKILTEDNSEAHIGSDAAVETVISETQLNGAFHEEKRWISGTLPEERLLAFGELLIAEYRNKGQVEYRKMFPLQEGARLQSSWGIILHDNIAGQPASQFLKTSRGFPILIRRPSLEDYVLHMKRAPVITYPKDASTMLMMMDVTEGDCVLDSGSGSGAMSLFLSRAVGSKGRVLSVEIRKDHHNTAVLNYKRWRTSWSLRRGEEWPDNVQFHIADLSMASSLLAGQGFHAVSLDMIHPQLVLPTVTPHMHLGAVCAVYLANITQVIDLLEGLRCLALPLLCERIIEVPIRDWVVAPAIQKDGRYCVRKLPMPFEECREEGKSQETIREELNTEEPPAFGNIPYIARPHPEQLSHTAFLVKLRKYVK
ncbi:tRNA (adenine(58)-N(1))-methyltransferase, mitochondrial [Mastacembelus armatus]|uniref:tRNA (adenine(58)-N(1))-methyltransferase n=1 Tax=Mastacembelus armatus TaxID=205130 RepID=A0A3Q3MJD5_9TELE|nr:tRNA (adenine(58)-N(1))-methyltransferase, mitochondrial [Mastacembelus armatus]